MLFASRICRAGRRLGHLASFAVVGLCFRLPKPVSHVNGKGKLPSAARYVEHAHAYAPQRDRSLEGTYRPVTKHFAKLVVVKDHSIASHQICAQLLKTVLERVGRHICRHKSIW